MYEFLCEHTFISLLILWGIFLGMELLHYMVAMFNPLRKCQTISKAAVVFHTSWWECIRIPVSPYSHQHLYLPFVNLGILVIVKYYLFLVLICIYVNDY